MWELALPSLLAHGKTQNQNESYNQIVWKRIPKTVFVDLETLIFGAYDAVSTYKDGNISIGWVFKKLEVRVEKEDKDALPSSKEKTQRKLQAKRSLK